MSRKPAPSTDSIAEWAQKNFGLTVQSLEPIPLGYDPVASVYRLETPDQT
ncbi:MAG: hypothetical protein SFU83_05950 [Meiothermus sp.]|nr:hypothetical protein [Meiothermus sp.]